MQQSWLRGARVAPPVSMLFRVQRLAPCKGRTSGTTTERDIMNILTKTLTLAAAASTLMVAAPAIAQDTGATLGFIGGFTGPIESLTPPIFAGAELVV